MPIEVTRSHPPLRPAILSKERALPSGPGYYVCPSTGDNANPGTVERPWRTIQHALEHLRPGDTLLLRGGVYFENVYCSIVGTEEAPITIRGYPGETAIIDGSLPEFQVDPASAWEPGDAPGEYVSRREFRNIRDVLGLFADSNIGLQTYWHHDYLLATNELAGINPATGKSEPYYCGPGLFYNKATGKIHIRLAHTRFDLPFVTNYTGETDPRRLPLAIAPFRASPLHLDQAMHLRLRDLILRGGGYNTLVMNFAVDVHFEYVTVYGGTYCVRSKNSGPVKMTHCGVYGQIPPWAFRDENCLATPDHVYYDPFTQPPEPRDKKNIARLPTHALLVHEGGEESDVFFFPSNNRWEVSYCEFADSHDGLYFNGHRCHLHHCWAYNMQDDVFYLTSPTPTTVCEDLHIRENYISQCMLPFGGHRRGSPRGNVYVYGNVVDMRVPVHFTRPSFELPLGRMQLPNQIGSFFLVHGYREVNGIENIGFFHNTAIITSRCFAGTSIKWTVATSTRSIYNNLFVYCNGLPPTPPPDVILETRTTLDGKVEIDGNLHWAPGAEEDPAWLARAQESDHSRHNVTHFGGTPWEQNSLHADPEFRRFDLRCERGNDYRLGPASPARNRAVDFPQKERLHGKSVGPHLGALQGEETLQVGINARITAG